MTPTTIRAYARAHHERALRMIQATAAFSGETSRMAFVEYLIAEARWEFAHLAARRKAV